MAKSVCFRLAAAPAAAAPPFENRHADPLRACLLVDSASTLATHTAALHTKQRTAARPRCPLGVDPRPPKSRRRRPRPALRPLHQPRTARAAQRGRRDHQAARWAAGWDAGGGGR